MKNQLRNERLFSYKIILLKDCFLYLNLNWDWDWDWDWD